MSRAESSKGGLILLPLLGAAAILSWVFAGALRELVDRWHTVEYGHGYLVVMFAGIMLWQARDRLLASRFDGSWAAVGLVLLALVMAAIGRITIITTVDLYTAWLVLVAMVWATFGGQGLRVALPALLLLLMAFPIPNFFYYSLSAKLQLLSSALSVWMMRGMGISVLLEGNVIDLGSYKLQVVEACSGLRYLLPLMTMGFIVACFFRAPFWNRALLFVSTLPITVLMNSLRIAFTGLMVERYGPAQAEGWLHDFEGWLLYMACFVLLILEARLLMWLRRDPRPLREVMGMVFPPQTPSLAGKRVPVTAWVALAVLALAGSVVAAIPHRTEIIPPRTTFASFPMQIGEWTGKPVALDPAIVRQLTVDDYVMADYVDGAGRMVNFYAAYYEKQRTGDGVHSPRTCIPGGGWEISDFREVDVPLAEGGVPLRVNRVVIANGTSRQLVYYWFQQRGRVIASEYAVKWYLLVDAVMRQRSDGALVRLVTALAPDEAESAAEARLVAFAGRVAPQLPANIPN